MSHIISSVFLVCGMQTCLSDYVLFFLVCIWAGQEVGIFMSCNGAYLDYSRYCSEWFRFTIIFFNYSEFYVMDLLCHLIAIKFCYFVFCHFLLKAVWRVIRLLVRV
jgi:hypothetical protein